jgi:hypothetical protein
MLWSSLDTIIRGTLLKQGKSVHWYVQYLTYACAGLSKLNTHTLKNINSKKLPVNAHKAVPLPIDYIDWVRVGIGVADKVRPLIYDNNLNRLYNFDTTTGRKIPYENTFFDGTAISTEDLYIPEGGSELYPLFGHDVSRDDFKFKVFKERGEDGEIQLSPEYPFDFVVLDYISDGLGPDAATKVDPLAVSAIEAYILWQAKLHSRSAGIGEVREYERRFHDEHRLLRASKSDLTIDEVVHAIRSGYSPLPKN